MFWASKKTVRLLTERIARLEGELETARAEASRSVEAMTSRLAGDLGRTPQDRTDALLAAVAGDLERSLVEQIERARQLAEASSALEDQISHSGAALRPQRLHMELGAVHRADTYGYVALYSEGGLTDKVQLLVGDTDPPTEVVGYLNSRNQINSYNGTVVRPGEYWQATTLHGPGRSAVRCVYTPFR